MIDWQVSSAINHDMYDVKMIHSAISVARTGLMGILEGRQTGAVKLLGQT